MPNHHSHTTINTNTTMTTTSTKTSIPADDDLRMSGRRQGLDSGRLRVGWCCGMKLCISSLGRLRWCRWWWWWSCLQAVPSSTLDCVHGGSQSTRRGSEFLWCCRLVSDRCDADDRDRLSGTSSSQDNLRGIDDTTSWGLCEYVLNDCPWWYSWWPFSTDGHRKLDRNLKHHHNHSSSLNSTVQFR